MSLIPRHLRILLFASVFISCAFADTVVTNSSIKYFGYYGTTDASANAMFADHSNLAFITQDQDSMIITNRAKLGVKSIIALQGLFQQNDSEGKLQCVLNSNAKDAWDKFVYAKKPYEKSIAAFYLVDEPYWILLGAGCTHEQVLAWITTAAQMVKRSFPNIPILVVEAYPKVFDANVKYPSSVDWVGFDCYPILQGGTIESCGDSGGKHSIVEYLAMIKSKLSPAQKLVLVPEAFYYGTQKPNSNQEAAVAAISDQFLKIANSEPRIVAVLPFLGLDWAPQPEGKAFTGALSMPRVKAVFSVFGKSVIQKNPWTAPTDPALISQHLRDIILK